MIDVTMKNGECEKWNVQGTAADLMAELGTLLSNIYDGVLNNALNELGPKVGEEVVHNRMRKYFIHTLATSMALTDAQVTKERLKKDIREADNGPEAFTLSEFFEMLYGDRKEDEDEHGNKST